MDNTSSNVALTVSTRQVDDTTQAVDLRGEVDVYTAPQLREIIVQLADDGARRILINLNEVDYVDSTGLSTLIFGHTHLADAGGSLILIGPRPRIARILEITGLNERLLVYPAESDALRA